MHRVARWGWIELTSHTSILRSVDLGQTPERARPVATVIPLQTARSSSRYGEQKPLNIGALLGSFVIVGGLVSSLFAMNVIRVHKDKPTLTMVEMLPQPEPPPPPPPQPQPKAAEKIQAPSPVVAPPPLVTTPPAPAQIATSPAPPPPEVTLPGPPSPTPHPAPSIESVGDLSSKMIAANPPTYPTESRRKREQGTVVLMVLLTVDGTVADISVSKSSGFERLDRAALSAVRRWRWSPTRRGGNPVMVRGLVEIPFILKN